MLTRVCANRYLHVTRRTIAKSVVHLFFLCLSFYAHFFQIMCPQILRQNASQKVSSSFYGTTVSCLIAIAHLFTQLLIFLPIANFFAQLFICSFSAFLIANVDDLLLFCRKRGHSCQLRFPSSFLFKCCLIFFSKILLFLRKHLFIFCLSKCKCEQLAVVLSQGHSCPLTPGDQLRRTVDTPQVIARNFIFYLFF